MATATKDFYFEVDDSEVQAMVRESTSRFDDFLTAVARKYASEIEQDAAPYSSRMAQPWTVEGIGPYERHVVAPEEAWFAHIVAHGARAHGTRTAERMVFVVDGETVGAEMVAGVPAAKFDETAWSRTRHLLDTLMRGFIERAD